MASDVQFTGFGNLIENGGVTAQLSHWDAVMLGHFWTLARFLFEIQGDYAVPCRQVPNWPYWLAGLLPAPRKRPTRVALRALGCTAQARW